MLVVGVRLLCVVGLGRVPLLFQEVLEVLGAE